MTPVYTAVLGLHVCPTDIGAQKIDRSMFSTYSIVLVNFQLKDKQGRLRFFQETFLVANTVIEVILGMLFLTLSKVKINFVERELSWRIYIPDKSLPTTKRVQIIN